MDFAAKAMPAAADEAAKNERRDNGLTWRLYHGPWPDSSRVHAHLNILKKRHENKALHLHRGDLGNRRLRPARLYTDGNASWNHHGPKRSRRARRQGDSFRPRPHKERQLRSPR